MATWIYKCNNQMRDYQSAYGDWEEVFLRQHSTDWGSTKWVPELAQARRRDRILAYQTERNELVGVARVTGFRKHGAYRKVLIRPVEKLGVKVRPLKRDPRIAAIWALRQGPIQTLYPISTTDANLLLAAAREAYGRNADTAEQEIAEAAKSGTPFGKPYENPKVEAAAMKWAMADLKQKGWTVRNVSKNNIGYDLLCTRPNESLHVEVKGLRGNGRQIILTENEYQTWRRDNRFRLCLVNRAMSDPSSIYCEKLSELEVRTLARLAKLVRD